MKIILILTGVAVAVVLAIVALGMAAPKDHEVSLERDYAVPAEKIYKLVRAYEDYPSWRSGVTAVTRDGDDRYIEESGHGRIPYKIVEQRPHARLVSQIDDPGLPFSGTWTFEIIDRGDACRLRITETGSVPNPVFRFFSTYMFSHEETIRVYLADLARKLGEK
ncbi:MAG TPA: SRPBCC family protein [Paucimonas sp.]|nr:SRPBCC family protein [Paucimonas sp.]